MDVRSKLPATLPERKESASSSQFDEFINAVRLGKLEDVRRVLGSKDKKFDIDQIDKYGMTALMTAAVLEHEKIVSLLLVNGAKIYAKTEEGMPVSRFFPRKQIAAVPTSASPQTKMLMQFLFGETIPFSKDFLAKLVLDADAEMIFHYALQLEYIKFIGFNVHHFVSLLFNFNKQDDAIKFRLKDGKTLFMAAQQHKNSSYMSYFSSYTDFTAKDRFGKTALMYDAENGFNYAYFILKSGTVNVNDTCNMGMSALMYAAIHASQQSKVDVGLFNDAFNKCRQLIDKGANIKQTDSNGKNALMHALEAGLTNKHFIYPTFCTPSETLYATTNQGKTILILAAQFCNSDIVEEIIKRAKGLLDQADRDGKTPLMYAAERGVKSIIEVLIKNNANTKAVDKKFQTARDYLNKESPMYDVLLSLFPQTSLSSAHFVSAAHEQKGVPAPKTKPGVRLFDKSTTEEYDEFEAAFAKLAWARGLRG